MQYLHYLGIVARGDLGISFKYGDPVVATVIARRPATVELAITALLIAVVIAVPLGL